jgi:hypothetical protein
MRSTHLTVACLALLASAMVCSTSRVSADDAAATPTTNPSAPTTQPASAATGPAKFYGEVSAVDTKANTFTVGDKTFNVTGEAKLTSAKDGSTLTLADVTVGEPARGSYTTTGDGKFDVTKVRFGKKSGGSGKHGGKKSKPPTTQPDSGSAN